MSELIHGILTAPLSSPLIPVLSVAYAIVESIRIYDARLIQAKTRGFYCGVAEEAEGRVLPNWVGNIHMAGWALFAAVLILNWKYAIALYAFLFLLRVLPVLERIGALIMRPFLCTGQNEEDFRSGAVKSIRQQRVRSANSGSGIRGPEKETDAARKDELADALSGYEAPPPFFAWVDAWLHVNADKPSIEASIDEYIERYDLLIAAAGEPKDTAERRTKCTILESALERVDPENREVIEDHLSRSQHILELLKERDRLNREWDLRSSQENASRDLRQQIEPDHSDTEMDEINRELDDLRSRMRTGAISGEDALSEISDIEERLAEIEESDRRVDEICKEARKKLDEME